jgi:hypothetical protein
MDYFESAEGVIITQQRALKELADHSADVEEFFTDLGVYSHYLATDVLTHLGY